jgi:hypothetical protein
MHKRQLHNYWLRLRSIPALAFLVVAIISALICVFALRANNLRMLELREAVFTADKEDGDIEGALRALRQHVYRHMNTDLTAGDNPIRLPIQLENRYERLLAAEKDRVQTTNANLYNEAQNYCEAAGPGGFSGRGRVSCVQDYVESKGVKEQPITEDLYKFDFISPGWSPDLAGWSMVIGILSFTAFILLFASEKLLKLHLHRHT